MWSRLPVPQSTYIYRVPYHNVCPLIGISTLSTLWYCDRHWFCGSGPGKNEEKPKVGRKGVNFLRAPHVAGVGVQHGLEHVLCVGVRAETKNNEELKFKKRIWRGGGGGRGADNVGFLYVTRLQGRLLRHLQTLSGIFFFLRFCYLSSTIPKQPVLWIRIC